jgi:archaellum component FlaG (FlaF/FlaG flagellin family)
VDVDVASGRDIICSVTNTRKASVTVRKVTEARDPTTQFAFSSGLPATAGAPAIAGDGTFSLTDGGAVTTKVAPYSYPVSENDPKGLGYKLVGLTCTEDGVQNSTVATGAAIAAERNATINADAGETISCTFTNRKVLAQPVVLKAGDTFAYHDGTASYTFAVSNTGNSPLHDVHVSDDKCPTVSATPTSKTNDNGDGLLDPIGTDGTSPEVWVFTCSYTIAAAHQAGEANPIVNTATVTAVDEYDRSVSDTDQHATTLLHPAIALTKTGPATALAGSLVTYALAVSNTGDVAFPAALVVLTDVPCEAPPQLVNTGTDASTATLDPGDSWSYSCSVQTSVGQTTVHNVANVDGTDIHGHHATAQAIADTALTQPAAPTRGASPNPPAPIVPLAPALARLRGPSGCAPVIGRFVVTGARIQKVRFTLDGHRAKTVTKADKRGRYVYSVRRKGLRTGVHRVKAQITFLPGSTLKTKTLRMASSRCRAAILPAFTG